MNNKPKPIYVFLTLTLASAIQGMNFYLFLLNGTNFLNGQTTHILFILVDTALIFWYTHIISALGFMIMEET